MRVFRRRATEPAADESATMIVPAGTEMVPEPGGLLSLRTPGSLVLQGRARFHTLESLHGSIRIEPGAEIEAVHVVCPEVCYVQGTLVAWRVAAGSLQLEDGARAHVVLQESARVEVGRGSRLVGNFGSENELVGMLQRFAGELRGVPLRVPGTPAAEGSLPPSASAGAPALPPGEPAAEPAHNLDDTLADYRPAEVLPDPLLFARMLLERATPGMSTSGQRVAAEIVKMLHGGEEEREALRLTHRTLFARLAAEGEDVRRAGELVAGYFG